MISKLQWRPLLQYSTSFVLYYLECLICGVVFVVMELCIKPTTENRTFNSSDTKIGKTFKPNELVGNGMCLFICAAAPFMIIMGYCLYGRSVLRNYKKPTEINDLLHLFHVSTLALFVVLTINGAITCCLKVLIANPRPDFIARCQPLITSTEGMFSIQDCQQSDIYTLYDGLRSTPSGHSSFAAAGLGFLYIWQTKFISTHKRRHLWCPLLALFIMISRVLDHKHHVSDLIYGSLVGLISLAIGWFQLIRPQLIAPDSWQLPRPVSHT